MQLSPSVAVKIKVNIVLTSGKLCVYVSMTSVHHFSLVGINKYIAYVFDKTSWQGIQEAAVSTLKITSYTSLKSRVGCNFEISDKD